MSISKTAVENQSPAPAQQLLLVGRWYAVTVDQQNALAQTLEEAGPGKLIFVITASDQGGTKRHPLFVEERKQVVAGLAKSLGRQYEVYAVVDIADSVKWTEHVRQVVSDESDGATLLDAANTLLISSNPDVLKRFAASGYRALKSSTSGSMPVDLLALAAQGKNWQELATEATRRVFEEHGIPARMVELFQDVLLNDDGELSHGRDFAVYSQGMDASLAVKIQDIVPHVRPGKIVDKGCGTGTLLIHLSELFPKSSIVGMDLSRELLHMSEGQHYPNHNVVVVKGNIIHQRFPEGSLSTVIFSSVMHEVYSYNGYDRDQVRLALTNTRIELESLGRIIIRDGIKPLCADRLVWLRCRDIELEERFRRFAREFKGKSEKPGFTYEERVHEGATWFKMSLHEAAEFLSKKDYVTNWAMEVNEEFGVFTVDEWAKELVAAGYRVVKCESYLNPWIAEHRYNGLVWLHADIDGEPGEALPFPDTTSIIVAEAV